MGMLSRTGENPAGKDLIDGEGSLQRIPVKPGEEQETADLLADSGEEFHFLAGVGVRLAMLYVDNADNAIAGDDRGGEESLIGIGFELGEGLEAGIIEGVPGQSDEAAVAGDPAGESLFKGETHATYGGSGRGVRGAQDKLLAIS